MRAMETLAASRFETPIGVLRVVCSDKGLAYLELPHQNGRGLAGWMKTHAPEAKLLDRRVANDGVIDQLLEYTEAARHVFELELDLRATAFQLAVYQHGGYWAAMDTYREAQQLNEEWRSGHPGWLED